MPFVVSLFDVALGDPAGAVGVAANVTSVCDYESGDGVPEEAAEGDAGTEPSGSVNFAAAYSAFRCKFCTCESVAVCVFR